MTDPRATPQPPSFPTVEVVVTVVVVTVVVEVVVVDWAAERKLILVEAWLLANHSIIVEDVNWENLEKDGHIYKISIDIYVIFV